MSRSAARPGRTAAGERGIALGAVVLGVSLALSGAAPAGAATYLDDAVEGLSGARGWVSAEVRDEVNVERVLAADPSGTVAVAVLPVTASLEVGATELAAELRATTEWSTVVVAVGADISASSAGLERDAALSIANEAEDSSRTLEGNLIQAVGAIGQALGSTEDGAAAAEPSESSGLLERFWRVVARVLLVLLLIPLAVVAVVVLVVLLRRRRRVFGPPVRVSRETPPQVAELLEVLRGLRARYLAVREPAAARSAAADMVLAITRIVVDTSELFRRLARKGGGDQIAVAEVEYRDQVSKVVAVLGEDYYLDILTRPELWDDPVGRARVVEDAIEAFAQQIIENTKQVNASQDLRFQVSLDSLARATRDQTAGLYDAPDERSEL
ncbi:MAG: hypothetical protein LBD97_06755 [Bifidobacteriaceae bacterium]|nr:hypothetical protein [Bifidobacteriaceae bacterium]